MTKRVQPRTVVAAIALTVLATGIAPGSAAAAEDVTYTADVAPILYENCLVCHRPGQVAPMAFRNYAETRPWARAIQDKVVSGEMPPWFADPRFGSFRNARGLSQDEVDAIVAWADKKR
jgi:mono/diheme cytochrome c family protein